MYIEGIAQGAGFKSTILIVLQHSHLFCYIRKVFLFSGKALQIFQVLNAFIMTLLLTGQWCSALLIQVGSEASHIGRQGASDLFLKREGRCPS